MRSARSSGRSSKRVWCELHEEAFAYFGGAPKMLRFDCLKEGVLKPDIYDPELNPLYAAVLAHYNIVALPCRPYAPNLKGKIESAVSHTQRALQGKRFKIIDDQNAFLMHWDENWASTRIHGTTKRQVREMFEQERSALLPLPPTRFEYYEVLERKVHFDGHIEVGGAYYSAPPRYVGANVVVHAGRLWLRILDPLSRQCVREHTIALTMGSRRTADADRPKQTPPQVEKLVARRPVRSSLRRFCTSTGERARRALHANAFRPARSHSPLRCRVRRACLRLSGNRPKSTAALLARLPRGSREADSARRPSPHYRTDRHLRHSLQDPDPRRPR